MQFICKINKNILGKYKEKIISKDVILTQERLENHILLYHKKDYEQLVPYLKDNLTKTRFAILVEKSREKLRRDGEKGINKIPVAAKPGKVINASNIEKESKGVKYTFILK